MKIKQIEIGEAEALLDRVKDSTLNQDDYELIKEFIDTLMLLDQAITEKNCSIKKLLKMIFGHKTEKTKSIKRKSKAMVKTVQTIMKEPRGYRFLTLLCNIAIPVPPVMMANFTDNCRVSLFVSKEHHHSRQLSMNRKNCDAMSVRRFSLLTYPQMQELRNMMRLLPLCLLYSGTEVDCP
jgi:hypothetical protein